MQQSMPSFGNAFEQPQMQQMMPPQNQVVYPSNIAMPPQTGGNPLSFPLSIPQGGMFPRISAGGDGVIQSGIPGMGNAIIVDTSGGAMAQMGLGQVSARRPRRYHGGSSMNESMGDMSPPPMSSFPSGGAIQVTKLE
jgi:hypothetical protein